MSRPTGCCWEVLVSLSIGLEGRNCLEAVWFDTEDKDEGDENWGEDWLEECWRFGRNGCTFG